MKVKCVIVYNSDSTEEDYSNYWLSIGKEYVVLAIEIYPGKDILYRLVGNNENKRPALYDASQFEVVSDKIPSNWTIHQLKCGLLDLSPKAWLTEGFWENFYDLEPEALETYKREARIIYEEEDVL